LGELGILETGKIRAEDVCVSHAESATQLFYVEDSGNFYSEDLDP
jgi:hypothetical protein